MPVVTSLNRTREPLSLFSGDDSNLHNSWEPAVKTGNVANREKFFPAKLENKTFFWQLTPDELCRKTCRTEVEPGTEGLLLAAPNSCPPRSRGEKNGRTNEAPTENVHSQAGCQAKELLVHAQLSEWRASFEGRKRDERNCLPGGKGEGEV